VSDTVTDSRPSTVADHRIVFGVPSGIPASGTIVITFEGDAFSIDPSFDFGDADIAVSPTSPIGNFTDRSLAAAPDAAHDGFSAGAPTGPMTVTLSSGGGIPANSYVRILLGQNATFGGQGIDQITNPSSTGSYRILLNTYDAGGAPLDEGAAMTAVLPAVGVDVNQDRVNPAVISNGMPSGTIPSNVNGVLLSVNTDVYSTCRYATSSGVAYDAMPNGFAHTSIGTFHTANFMGPFAKGTTYDIYVRCMDFVGNVNPNDYVIEFKAGDPTGTGLGGGTGGGPVALPGTGGGSGGGGDTFPAPPPQPSLILKGLGVPGTPLSILQDGKQIMTARVGDGGIFSVSIPALPQGTYSFTIVEEDAAGDAIASYTTTLTVVLGTTNSVTNILLPPGLSLATSTVSPGSDVIIAGSAPPLSLVTLAVISQTNAQNPVTTTTLANGAGAWSVDLATKGFAVDTYLVKARAELAGFGSSNYSNPAYLGVGKNPSSKGLIGDVNGDGKVNLVDFSILLFHWNTDFAGTDFNGDGTVNLTDFSILLFHWTG